MQPRESDDPTRPYEQRQQWPDSGLVYDVLANAYVRDAMFTGNEAGGWRCMAELAGIIECPDFARLQVPLLKLVEADRVERRGFDAIGGAGIPSVYRAKKIMLYGTSGYEYFESEITGQRWEVPPVGPDVNPSVEVNLPGWVDPQR